MGNQSALSVSERTMETLMDLDIAEWSLVRNKMLRFHFNISEEIKAVVQSIRAEMRDMWSLEYEVDGLQSKFSESIGTLDLDNLDVDFIEDMMLKAKPLQSVLNDI